MIFTDTVTVFHKEDAEWSKSVVKGVQWVDKSEKTNADGILSVARYASVTFPEGTYEGLELNPLCEEDCIFYGEIQETIKEERGCRVSNLMNQYPRSGRIKSVKDNSSRTMLKSKRVILA